MSTSTETRAAAPTTVYSWREPPPAEPPLRCADHFSSLLFGGSWADTALELALLAAPVAALLLLGAEAVDVPGSMPLAELAGFYAVAALLRRVYNAYLEAVWFACPQHRTQPPSEHRLKAPADLCGREVEQLAVLDRHNKLTALSQFALNWAMFFALPGFYPAAGVGEPQTLSERFLRLLLNHCKIVILSRFARVRLANPKSITISDVMSFGMYWAHRALHEVPFLWVHVHSIHHWAKHPLSRNTYEDHWSDNFGNAIVGHLFAQILVPLDNRTAHISPWSPLRTVSRSWPTYGCAHRYLLVQPALPHHGKSREALRRLLQLQPRPQGAAVPALRADAASSRLAPRRAQGLQLHVQLDRRVLGLHIWHAKERTVRGQHVRDATGQGTAGAVAGPAAALVPPAAAGARDGLRRGGEAWGQVMWCEWRVDCAVGNDV